MAYIYELHVCCVQERIGNMIRATLAIGASFQLYKSPPKISML